MKTIVNFDPISEFDRLNAMMERVFGQPVRSSACAPEQNLLLPVDIYEREGSFVVKAAVPGVKPEELDVQVEDQVLTIHGETRNAEDLTEAKVYRREYTYGKFTRSIRLPGDLDLENIDARFDHGFVTITIPKVPEPTPTVHKVNVRRVEDIEAVLPESQS